MKLEYYWLGLVFIVIFQVPYVYMAKWLSVYPTNHCCPHHNETYSGGSGDCQNGEVIELKTTAKTQTAGTYCKTLKKCFAGYGLSSFRCKISNSEEYSCSNQTSQYKVCRGTLTSKASCRK